MIKYKDGTESKVGDVIRWHCWDSDDFTTWTFTGVVKGNGVLYIGGGIDFGGGFGEMISFDEVVEDSENNDPCEVGVVRICEVKDIVRLVRLIEEGDYE